MLVDGTNTAEATEETGAEESAPQIDSVDALGALLDGNTESKEQSSSESTEAPEEPEESEEPEEPEETDEEPSPDKEADSKANRAFAAMRKENTELHRTIAELAKALNIDTKDLSSMNQSLRALAQKRLAEQAQLPEHVYKELTSTKERLQELERERNIGIARGKLSDLQEKYELNEDQMREFLSKLDGKVDPVNDPNIDFEYHYFTLYKDELEKQRIQAAVEAALRQDKKASETSTTPGKHSGGDSSSGKIETVADLSAFLDTR